MEVRSSNSVNYNAFLRDRKKKVDQAIREMQQVKHSSLLPISNDEGFAWDKINLPKKQNMESMSEINKNTMATEELCQINFLKYETGLLSNEISPQGVWREVRAQILVLGWLKVSLTFIEDMKNTTNPSILTNCSVINGPSLAISELAPMAEVLENDVPSLFERLKEYAQLAKDRSDTIQAFSNLYKYCLIRSTANGIVLEWQKLFELVWSLKLCEFTKKVVNVIEISVDNREIDFIKTASVLLEEISNNDQSTDERHELLMKLGACASSFS